MALPSGHEARTRDEWASLAKDNDPANRRLVTGCLRDLGVDPVKYMQMPLEERLDIIMQAQEGGEEEPPKEEKAKAASSGKTKVSTGKTNGASAGGSVDSAAVAELKKQVDKMSEQLDDVQQTNAQLTALVSDMHFLVRVLVQSNKQLMQNSEDEGIQETLYGQLVVTPPGN